MGRELSILPTLSLIPWTLKRFTRGNKLIACVPLLLQILLSFDAGSHSTCDMTKKMFRSVLTKTMLMALTMNRIVRNKNMRLMTGNQSQEKVKKAGETRRVRD